MSLTSLLGPQKGLATCETCKKGVIRIVGFPLASFMPYLARSSCRLGHGWRNRSIW